MEGAEEVISAAPGLVFAGAFPIRVVVILTVKKYLGMRHETEAASALILQAGDALEAAVDLVAVSERGRSARKVLGGLGSVFGDETALGVGDGELELRGEMGEEGTRRSEVLQRDPLALEATARVFDETA